MRSIRLTISSISICLITVLSFLSFIGCYSISRESISNVLTELKEAEITVLVSKCDEVYLGAQTLWRSIATDQSMNSLVDELYSAEESSIYKVLTNIRSYMRNTISSQNYFSQLILTTDTYKLTVFKNGNENFEKIVEEEDSGGPSYMESLISQYNSPSKKIFTIAIKDMMLLTGSLDFGDILGGLYEDYIVVDDEGNFIEDGYDDSEISSMLYNAYKEDKKTVAYENNTYILVSRQSTSTGLRVISGYPVITLFTETNMFLICIAATLLSILISIFLMQKYIKELINPLYELQEAIRRIDPEECKEKIRHICEVNRSNRNVQEQLWDYFVKICMLPLLVIMLFYVVISTVFVTNVCMNNYQKSVEQSTEFIQSKYKQCASSLRNMCIDYSIQKYFHNKDLYLSDYALSSILWGKCAYLDNVNAITLYDLEWNVLYSSGTYTIDIDEENKSSLGNDYALHYYTNEENETVMLICCRNTGVYANDNPIYEKLGYIAISVSFPYDCMNTISSIQYLGFYLDNENIMQRTVISDTSDFLFLPSSSNESKIAYTDLAVAFSVSYLNMGGTVIDIIVYCFLLILVLFTTLLLISHKITKQILHSMFTLVKLIEDTDTERIPDIGDCMAFTQSEFKTLAIAFREMLITIKNTNDELTRKEIESIEMEKRQTDLQLIAVESQLSPHFLFNIFTSIRFLMEEGDNNKAIAMFQATAKMFRSVIYKGQSLVLLSEEVEHMLAYYHVQSFRFAGRIELNISAFPGDANHIMVPKYILQPLIENAIQYALTPHSVLKIDVSIRLEDALYVSVADNGNHMTEEEICSMQKNLLTYMHTGHCGLSNIHQRIQLHFGKEYGLHLSKNKPNGLIVTINMPIHHSDKTDRDKGER